MKIAGISTAVSLTTLTGIGYGLFHSAQGEPLPTDSPYLSDSTSASNNPGESGTEPILVLTNSNSSNPFGTYYEEILRAEGFNCFQSRELSSLSQRSLDEIDIVLLAEGPLNSQQVELLERFVYNGGGLIAMHPDLQLENLLGIQVSSSTTRGGYLQINKNHSICLGINSNSLQFHGKADLFTLSSAESLVWLSDDTNKVYDHALVTINAVGKGYAVSWAFDLAKSIALMRQGNPDWANQDRDDLNGIRTVDMFVDWIDLDRIAIPQADELQRLLGNILYALSQGKRPLPRLWYFAENSGSALIVTGDSHMNPAPFIEEVYSLVEAYNGEMSVYYSPEIFDDFGRILRRSRFWATDHIPVLGDILAARFTSPTPMMVQQWRARGHEFTLHPWVEEGIEKGWSTYWKEFTGRGYGPVSETVRTHRILWSGWVETARMQALYGIHMNMDYYHVGPRLKKPNGEWVYGHLTGSGRPMKFIDQKGNILNIFQQLTQLADEHLLSMDVPGWGGWPDLSPQAAIEVYKFLLDRSIQEREYCAIGGQFHVDPFQVGGEAAEKGRLFLMGVLTHARNADIPIWSAQHWSSFIKFRHQTKFVNLNWINQDRVQFQLSTPANLNHKLSVMLPMWQDDRKLVSIEIDGVQASLDTRRVGGIEYALTVIESASKDFIATYQK
jgi:hypothetical protein